MQSTYARTSKLRFNQVIWDADSNDVLETVARGLG